MLDLIRRLLGYRRRAREIQKVADTENVETHDTQELKMEIQKRVEDQRLRVEKLEYQASVKGRYENGFPSQPR